MITIYKYKLRHSENIVTTYEGAVAVWMEVDACT